MTHEYLRALHPPAGRHHAAHRRHRARRAPSPSVCCPVSPLPQVDFPTISVNASLPGASPETMASSVATPLERQFGRIAAVTEMTSSSTLGSTSITLQFDLNRNIDAAARDVQAAINAARGYLPPTCRAIRLPQGEPRRFAHLHDRAHVRTCSTRARCTTPPPPSWRRSCRRSPASARLSVGGSALPGVRIELNPDRAEQVRHRPGTGPHRPGERQRQHAEGPLLRTATACGRSAPTTRSSRPSTTSR